MERHLEQELREQLTLLAVACKAFDGGRRPLAKHIALSLRVLLHGRGQSGALLHQLGYLSQPFFASGRDLNPRNPLTECGLCFMRMKAGAAARGGSFEPFLDEAPLGQARWLSFEDWWHQTIAKDKSGRRLSRKELVRLVSEADGGGQVDPLLDAAYLALSRENSLGWRITPGDGSLPLGGPEPGCVRQIAHELLETLKAARISPTVNL